MVKALRAPARRRRFVYEAGPCGFGIHRYLAAQGEECVVVNPSSTPKRSGDRDTIDETERKCPYDLTSAIVRCRQLPHVSATRTGR